MSQMLDALMNPGSMSQSQWMLLAIFLFIVVAVLYFVYRLYHVIKSIGKSSYKPNIGLSRIAQEPEKWGDKAGRVAESRLGEDETDPGQGREESRHEETKRE